VALGLGACSSGSDTSSTGSTTLNIVQTADLTQNFDPYNLNASNEADMYQLYDTLIREDSNRKPQPRLASSWAMAADGLSLTLNLRAAKFADGTPITSSTVADNIKLVQDAGTGANIQVLALNVVGVETPSPTTVILKFAKPFPGVFDLLDLLSITDRGTSASNYAKVNASGPYQLTKYTPGVGYTMTANPNFWGTKPKITTVNVKIEPDAQTVLNSLSAGTVDYAGQVLPQNYNTLAKTANTSVGYASLGNSVIGISLNITKPPLNDANYRAALSLALDRQRIVTDFLMPGAQAACLPFTTKGQMGYDADLAKTCRFDLTAARQALAKSKAQGPLVIETSTKSNPLFTQVAQVFQADLAKIGITAKIQDVDAAQWSADNKSGRYQVLMESFGRANLDPSTLFSTDNPWVPGSRAHGDDPQYTQLVNEAATTTDSAKRSDLYRQIDELILQENFLLPVVTNPKVYAAKSSLKGVAFSNNGQLLLEGATFK
jgi:peptide/nickel transport system substrate-binding protein